MILINILLNIIFPVFVIVGFGFVIGRRMAIDVRSVSRMSLYIFSPALIFSSTVKSSLTSADFTQIISFVFISALVMGIIAWLAAKSLRMDAVHQSAMMLAVLIMNSGNYGLSVNFFAFGQPGLDRAVIFFAASSFLTNTVAVYIASRGQASFGQSLANIFRVPMVYAMVAALLIRAFQLHVPDPILRPLDLAGQASVPLLLTALGLELSRASLRWDLPAISLAVVIRLVVGMIVAVGLAAVLGLTGLTRQVSIVEASMPTAVFVIVLALEFGADPRFLTGVVVTSTLASVVTITALLAWLM